MAGPPWLAWLAPLAWPLVLTAPLPWPLVETPTPLLATPLAALGVSKGRSCSMASWKFVEEIFHKAVKLRNFWNPQLTPFFQIGSIYDVYRENNNDYQVIGQVAKKKMKSRFDWEQKYISRYINLVIIFHHIWVAFFVGPTFWPTFDGKTRHLLTSFTHRNFTNGEPIFSMRRYMSQIIIFDIRLRENSMEVTLWTLIFCSSNGQKHVVLDVFKNHQNHHQL